eukprot:UN28368
MFIYLFRNIQGFTLTYRISFSFHRGSTQGRRRFYVRQFEAAIQIRTIAVSRLLPEIM